MLQQAGSADIERCPISENDLNALLHTSPADAANQTQNLPEAQRCRLVVFCYRRSHLRQLGLAIAVKCSKRGLIEEAGHAGELIHFQATNIEATLASDTYMTSRHVRRAVSLHRV